ncbi:hypothetical protein [Streptomyces sp. NPDC003832]
MLTGYTDWRVLRDRHGGTVRLDFGQGTLSVAQP